MPFLFSVDLEDDDTFLDSDREEIRVRTVRSGTHRHQMTTFGVGYLEAWKIV